MFDPTKPVQTRGGEPARILCTDKKGCLPIVALVKGADLLSYTLDGQFVEGVETHLDLINIPPVYDYKYAVGMVGGNAAVTAFRFTDEEAEKTLSKPYQRIDFTKRERAD